MTESNPYCGVTLLRGRIHKRWQAQIWHDNTLIAWHHRFETPQEAARVADIMAVYLKGPDAILNFDGSPPAGITREEIKAYLKRRGVLPLVWCDAEPPQFSGAGIGLARPSVDTPHPGGVGF